MNDALVRWVQDESPADGATYWTHLTLAMHADGHRHVRCPQATLARAARLNVGTLRRSVRELVDAGLVVIVEQPTGQTPALLRLEARAVSAPTARRERGLEGAPGARSNGVAAAVSPIETHSLDLELEDQPPTKTPRRKREPRPFEPRARGIVDRVWLAKKPKPAQPYPAVVKIAEALLGTGDWSDADVYDAMLDAPTISTRSCEVARRAVAERVARTFSTEPASGRSFATDRDQVRPVAGPWVCTIGNEYCSNGWVDDPDRPRSAALERCACQTEGTT